MGKQARALSREAAHRLRQMYEERDADGNRVWSMPRLAAMLGVGETTVWRAVNRLGPYQGLPEIKTEGQMSREAQESLQRMLAAGLPVQVVQEHPEDSPALAKMQRQMQGLKELQKERDSRADKLLGELTGENDERGPEGT